MCVDILFTDSRADKMKDHLQLQMRSRPMDSVSFAFGCPLVVTFDNKQGVIPHYHISLFPCF